ncbi:uncharacterized protein LOC107610763 [Arachis ipaensis]|uniref:uncharacterized protein LOC107610763 n=1 Tax=Arachis ipaensis TaxID=130454 RepID=UPI0007AFDF08|nr:uncharacterized protein LOC107610763 [Arachis ipaensis]XP_025670046.1 uncharacterized protein LOC112769795 [Arachis hypogaea]
MKNNTWKLVQLPPNRRAIGIFVGNLNGAKIFVLVYVDDIIVIGKSEDTIKQVIKQLNAKFSLKDMGSLHYFLGIQVSKTSNGGLILTQQKYIKELMRKANMVGCSPYHTPLPSTIKLSTCGGAKFDDPALYRMSLENGEKGASLNGMASYGLQLKKEHGSQSSMRITTYCDSDWAGDPDDKKSTSGYCVFLRSNLVSWASKKQTAVARSSTEAEYRSMADLIAELI